MPLLKPRADLTLTLLTQNPDICKPILQGLSRVTMLVLVCKHVGVLVLVLVLCWHLLV